MSRDELSVEVGAKLKRCRTGAGMTQVQVAEQLKVAAQTVSAWEGGSREPGLRSLFELSTLFGTSVGDFFPGGAGPVVMTEEAVDVRLGRAERQLRTLRGELYALVDRLTADGILEEAA